MCVESAELIKESYRCSLYQGRSGKKSKSLNILSVDVCELTACELVFFWRKLPPYMHSRDVTPVQ